MILTGNQIVDAVRKGEIDIKPFDPSCVGANSYDVRLAPTLSIFRHSVLDLKVDPSNGFFETVIDESGYTLFPGIFYLGVTREWTSTPNHVPKIDGRSTIGRYNMVIHQTAGYGDIGYAGHWTLEITVTVPLCIYPNMRVGQMSFLSVNKDENSSHRQYPGGYNNPYEPNPKPRIPRSNNF